MGSPQATCWTVIEGAAAGDRGAGDQFARLYDPVIRDFLTWRWRDSACQSPLDDAVQEVFLECIKPGGALSGVERGRGRFRSFLKGVVNNVARRVERRRSRDRLRPSGEDAHMDEAPDDAESQSCAFDRAWALALIGEARRLLGERARSNGPESERRFELLRLRFEEGLSIREVARRWQTDADALRHGYDRARREFLAVLLEIMAFHHPGAAAAELERECADLLSLIRKKT